MINSLFQQKDRVDRQDDSIESRGHHDQHEDCGPGIRGP